MEQRTQLYYARYSKGWSQEEAAGQVGVARNTYLQWERGKTVPYPINVHRLCEVFEMPAEALGLAAKQEKEEEMDLSRRQLFASGIGLLSLAASEPTIAVEEFLPQCASALHACWHLMQGKGLILSEQLLNAYLPTLTKLILLPSKYQETAASLAAQAKLLQALHAMHKMNIVGREMYCHEAVSYSTLAGDTGLIVAAKLRLGAIYTHCVRRPEKAITVFLDALHTLGNEEEAFLRSQIYMCLAIAYAQRGETQDALKTIGLAKEHFPDHPEQDPRFLYAECNMALLHDREGKMYLDLARHAPDHGFSQRAHDIFNQSAHFGAFADRNTSETAIHHAEAALGMGDMEHFAACLRDGALRGLEVGSQKRYNEALTVFKRTPNAWMREPVVQALKEDLFQPRQIH